MPSALPPVHPIGLAGTPAAAARARSSSESGTVTSTRAADSENSATNGSTRGSPSIIAPAPPIRHDSTNACARPPSERSCALVSSPSAGRGGEQPREALLGGQVDRGRPPTQVPVRDVRPLAAAELLAGLPEQDDHVAVAVEPRPHPPRDVLDHAEHARPPASAGSARSPVWL